MCGDPPNIIISASLGYSFTDFVTNTGVIGGLEQTGILEIMAGFIGKINESFVIVWRCSETILKQYDCIISIFILADRDKRTERIMRLYHLTESQAVKKIRDKDTSRRRYHNSFCVGKWGDCRNYDVSLNSSKLGIDGSVKLLTEYIDRRKQ